MDKSDSSKAREIARAARAFEHRTTGRLPGSVVVVLNEDTVIITLRGTLSPAETALAKTPDGAAQLREFHRQLFATASRPLCEEIGRITGVEVREATAELETSTGTIVQVFTLAHRVPGGAWTGSEPAPAANEDGANGGTTAKDR